MVVVMDANVLAERILLDLKNTFKRDPLIDEFDILPVSDSLCNKCPVVHVEHKVALESWCVQHVYVYAYSKFIKWKQHPHRIDTPTLLNLTGAILLINPDMETAWNTRKELIQSGQHVVQEELRFSAVVLSRKPKSPQVFAHRKWVLMWLTKNSSSVCAMKEIIENEIILCSHAASKYSNNYYAWNHRMWIIQYILAFCPKVLEKELQLTKHWVSSHVSDHSGFHFRQFLISCKFLQFNSEEVLPKFCLLHSSFSTAENDQAHCCHAVCDADKLLCCILTEELLLLSDLQTAFQGHETLWNHRRFIIHKISQSSDCAKSSHFSSNCRKSIKPKDFIGCKKHKLECRFCSAEKWMPVREESFLHQCFQKAKNNDWEKKLILRHITWLNKTALCPISLPDL